MENLKNKVRALIQKKRAQKKAITGLEIALTFLEEGKNPLLPLTTDERLFLGNKSMTLAFGQHTELIFSVGRAYDAGLTGLTSDVTLTHDFKCYYDNEEGPIDETVMLAHSMAAPVIKAFNNDEPITRATFTDDFFTHFNIPKTYLKKQYFGYSIQVSENADLSFHTEKKLVYLFKKPFEAIKLYPVA